MVLFLIIILQRDNTVTPSLCCSLLYSKELLGLSWSDDLQLAICPCFVFQWDLLESFFCPPPFPLCISCVFSPSVLWSGISKIILSCSDWTKQGTNTNRKAKVERNPFRQLGGKDLEKTRKLVSHLKDVKIVQWLWTKSKKGGQQLRMRREAQRWWSHSFCMTVSSWIFSQCFWVIFKPSIAPSFRNKPLSNLHWVSDSHCNAHLRRKSSSGQLKLP